MKFANMEKNEVITLEDRGFIQVTGVDAKDFLQNIVTNDLEKVTNESSIFSSILTPQGKYLFEFVSKGSPILASALRQIGRWVSGC